MADIAVEEFVKISRQEYNLLKEVYLTVQRQVLLTRIGEAETAYAAGKTKTVTPDELLASI